MRLWLMSHAYCCHLIGQFWDIRQPNPVMTLDLPERLYCADVVSGWAWQKHCGTSSYRVEHCHFMVPPLIDCRISPLVWWAPRTAASSV